MTVTMNEDISQIVEQNVNIKTLTSENTVCLSLSSLFVHMNQTPASVQPHHRRAPFFGFCSQVFRQTGPPQRVDCLASVRNKRKVSFPRIQRRIASPGIEPRASNLSIANPTLYH